MFRVERGERRDARRRREEALAGVAALGFVIGLIDLGPMTVGPNSEELVSIVADNDLGAVVFAPDPLPEAHP